MMDTIEFNLESYVEVELAKLQGPKKYYAVSSPYDRVSVQGKRIRRDDYELWQSQLPAMDEDIELVLARLRRLLGRGDGYLTSALYAHQRITEMPKLRAVQEKMYHLDLERLKAIDAVMSKADATVSEHLAVIDGELADYLTPTRANQLLPSGAQIRNKLNAIIQSLDDTVSADDSPPEVQKESFDVVYDHDRAFLNVALDPADAKEIENRVRKHAAQEDISQIEAFKRLVRGEGSTDISLNVYRAHDVPGAPGWMPGVGYLSSDSTDRLASQAGTVRDMDDLYDKTVSAYQTPPDIRAVVIGWDGTCSTGYCEPHEDRTQMDHRIDHKDGGETTAANLSAQCPNHHNIKTDGRVFYLIDPHTRDKFFLYEDGTWVVVEAKGPLAPKERHWVHSVGQRIQNRRDRIRMESQEKRAEELQSRPPPLQPAEEPPPF